MGVKVKLGQEATLDGLKAYDEVIIATGVQPRMPPILGLIIRA